MDDLRLPFFTSFIGILTVFLCALAVFHFSLVWPRNLSKREWKIVDYVWLTVALVGVIGSLGITRETVAQGLLTTASARLESSAFGVESALRFGTSGAICRRFVRGEFSPPTKEFERIQQEYDEQCAWFQEALKRYTSYAKQETLTLADFGGPPPKGGDDWALASLRQSLVRYNEAAATLRRLAGYTGRSDFESLLVLFGPHFLAIALALRMAKVSGEIRHESRVPAE